MNYKNLKVFSLGCAACLALLTPTMFWGCSPAENDFDALGCFSRDCSDDEDDDDWSSNSNGDSKKKKKPSDCDYYVDGLLEAPHCYGSNYDYGKTLYNSGDGLIYSCEDNGFTDEGYWEPHYNISSCSDYINSYSSDEYDDQESSSSQAEIPDGCDFYTGEHESVKDYPCDFDNVGSTLYDEGLGRVFLCDYMGSHDNFYWADQKERKSCWGLEPTVIDDDPESSSDSEPGSGSSASVLPPFVSSSSNNASVNCGDLWCGPNHQYVVETGFDDDSYTSGHWLTFDDKVDGGSSTIMFPAELGNVYNSYAINPVIDECGDGICGTVFLTGTNTVFYAGLLFNLVNEYQDPANITDWQGICVTYEATDSPPMIEIVPYNEVTVTGGIDNYVAPLSSSETMVNIPWSDFEQELNGNYYYTSIDNVLAAAVAIKIVWKSTKTVTRNFKITSIGRYGTCQ